MKQDEFNKVLKDTITKIDTVLGAKAGEYAVDGDRLHNFKRAGALAGTTPEKALQGMMLKHIVSLWDMLDTIKDGDLPNLELWNEKLIDTINYCILCKALIYERYDIENAKRTQICPKASCVRDVIVNPSYDELTKDELCGLKP